MTGGVPPVPLVRVSTAAFAVAGTVSPDAGPVSSPPGVDPDRGPAVAGGRGGHGELTVVEQSGHGRERVVVARQLIAEYRVAVAVVRRVDVGRLPVEQAVAPGTSQ